jgi:hypothetical protein
VEKKPSSLKGRIEMVKKREQQVQAALTRNEVHDHFERVLVGTKWEQMRALHTLRLGVYQKRRRPAAETRASSENPRVGPLSTRK